MAEATEENLAKARDLYVNNVNCYTSYSIEQAMLDAGIESGIAGSTVFKKKLESKIEEYTGGTPLSFPPDDPSKVERFVTLYTLLYRVDSSVVMPSCQRHTHENNGASTKFRSFSNKLEAQAHKPQHEQQKHNFLALSARTIVQRVEARRERRESSSQHHY